MKKLITFLIFTLSFSSPLDSWIKDKSKLMDKNNFIVSFEYKLESDTSSVPVMKNIHYYSFKNVAEFFFINNFKAVFLKEIKSRTLIFISLKKQKILKK